MKRKHIQRDLAKALNLHQAGNLIEAADIYQKILSLDPENVDALNLMGLIFQAANEYDLAATLLEKACQLAPEYVAPLVNLGNVYQEAGRLDDALTAFQKAITLEPNSGPAYNNLGSCLNALERFEDAIKACVDGLAKDPNLTDLHVNMGNGLLGLKKPEEALQSFKKAIENGAEGNANAWFNTGNAMMDLEQYEQACGAFSQAVALENTNPEIHYNFANALQQIYRFEEAKTYFEAALDLRPNYVDALCNLASVHQSLGKSDKAVELLKTALTQDVGSPDLHWNLALACLQNGEYKVGWAEYEWRWKTEALAPFERQFEQPLWDGSDLAGQTLFIHAEQGFGDAIQFVRYVNWVAQKGGRIVLECRPQLERLFSKLDVVDTIVPLGDDAPDFDVHVPIMSLPHLKKTSLETVPADIPYLKAPEKSSLGSDLFANDDLKIGLVWAGSATRKDNEMRSCPLEDVMPLLKIEGTRFYSLQVGPFQDDLKRVDGADKIVDLAPYLHDFSDTASALEAVDILVSVDTAVLHLAGALGRPSLALMSQPTGFLWMDERADSPWYPTTKLFRQPKPETWAKPVDLIRLELLKRLKD